MLSLDKITVFLVFQKMNFLSKINIFLALYKQIIFFRETNYFTGTNFFFQYMFLKECFFKDAIENNNKQISLSNRW